MLSINQFPKINVQLDAAIRDPQQVVQDLASRAGSLDVYCWYEGPKGLPQSGAQFYRDYLLEPLLSRKRDATFYLYSLKGWDFVRTPSYLPDNPLGDAINRIGSAAIRCIYSSSFFQYCSRVPVESGLYRYINEELPKKVWLANISAHYKPSQMTVAQLFDNKTNLFDSIRDLDVKRAYSFIHYVEGYYLIQESVKKALAEGNDKIQISFVLPNDEGKYYRDLPQDLEAMLWSDFGDALNGVEIDVSFLFFRYGDSQSARPYIDRAKTAPNVSPDEIGFYLPRVEETSRSNEETRSWI
jgi:hypothetical protein